MQHHLLKCFTFCRDAAPTAEMQHQLHRCSNRYRDAAQAAEIQYQLEICFSRCSYTSTEKQHQLQGCSTDCTHAAPGADIQDTVGMQHWLQRKTGCSDVALADCRDAALAAETRLVAVMWY